MASLAGTMVVILTATMAGCSAAITTRRAIPTTLRRFSARPCLSMKRRCPRVWARPAFRRTLVPPPAPEVPATAAPAAPAPVQGTAHAAPANSCTCDCARNHDNAHSAGAGSPGYSSLDSVSGRRSSPSSDLIEVLVQPRTGASVQIEWDGPMILHLILRRILAQLFCTSVTIRY